MSYADDIKTFLAENPETMYHRNEIGGALMHIPAASVDSTLSALVARKEILKPRTAYFQHKSEMCAWENTSATPTVRICALLMARGPQSERAIQKNCPDIKQMRTVLFDMGQGGHIHNGGDGVWAIGRNPRAPTGPRPPINARGIHRAWDGRRETNTTVEAAIERDVSAEAASEVHEAIATPTLTADEPDVSAVSETPAPEIGPALEMLPSIGADYMISDQETLQRLAEAQPIGINRIPILDEIIQKVDSLLKTPLEDIMKADVIKLHAQEETAQPPVGSSNVAEIAGGIEKVTRGFGNGGGGVMMREPTVIFSLRTDELEIEIGGDDERALTAIRAVLQSLTLSKANAE